MCDLYMRGEKKLSLANHLISNKEEGNLEATTKM